MTRRGKKTPLALDKQPKKPGARGADGGTATRRASPEMVMRPFWPLRADDGNQKTASRGARRVNGGVAVYPGPFVALVVRGMNCQGVQSAQQSSQTSFAIAPASQSLQFASVMPFFASFACTLPVMSLMVSSPSLEVADTAPPP